MSSEVKIEGRDADRIISEQLSDDEESKLSDVGNVFNIKPPPMIRAPTNVDVDHDESTPFYRVHMADFVQRKKTGLTGFGGLGALNGKNQEHLCSYPGLTSVRIGTDFPTTTNFGSDIEADTDSDMGSSFYYANLDRQNGLGRKNGHVGADDNQSMDD